MRPSITSPERSKRIRVALATLFWLILWQILAMALGQGYLLASPAAVLKELARLLTQPDSWLAALRSGGRIMIGFLGAAAFGTALAFLSARLPLVRDLAAPLPLTVCGSTTISGKITMQGRSAGNVDPGKVTLTDLGSNFTGPFSANFGNDGLFSLTVPVMPDGSEYQMDAAHGLYLTNRKTPVALTYGVPLTGQDTRLWGGDANNDGKVLIGDLSCIGGSFGLVPSTCGGVGSADINADSKVNVQDLAIAGGNFDKTSPQPW